MFLRGTVSSAQRQGPREYQEDYLVHVPFTNRSAGRGHLLGVLDGHGGGDVAQYCVEAIPRLFDPSATDVEKELRALVEKLDARTCLADMGSTLSLALVNESQEQVVTAILGDSPILVIDDEGIMHQSEEHNVRSNESERAAAIQRGAVYSADGYIQLVANGDGLQLSRALGDHKLREVLSRTPSINRYRLNSRSLVLVASDGLLDPGHDESSVLARRICRFATQKDVAADEIMHWRESQDLQDNASLIVWKAKRWWDWF